MENLNTETYKQLCLTQMYRQTTEKKFNDAFAEIEKGQIFVTRIGLTLGVPLPKLDATCSHAEVMKTWAEYKYSVLESLQQRLRALDTVQRKFDAVTTER